MIISARKVPYSSTVGQAVLIVDEAGSVVCQLAIMNVRKDLDYRSVAENVATLICLHFNDGPAEMNQ